MNQNLTNTTSVPATATQQHDYILLDGSSSMATRWLDSLRAIDKYVEEIHSVNTTVHCAVFTTGPSTYTDHGYESTLHYDLCRQATPDQWVPLSLSLIHI